MCPSCDRIAESKQPVLETEAVSVSLGGQAVLKGVSISVTPGEILGILGPSGAGKTTLFRVLAGELRPQSGTVHMHQRDVTRLPLWKRARRGLGYQPQLPSVLFDLTVRDNLRAFERIAKVRPGSAVERARHLDLEHRLEVRAKELSGGERRRLEVLRALTAQPSVLVCDEPFAGVDPVGATRLAAAIRDHTRTGAAVVIADHRVADALALCDRAALMVDGELAVTVAASEFTSHELVKKRYLG